MSDTNQTTDTPPSELIGDSPFTGKVAPAIEAVKAQGGQILADLVVQFPAQVLPLRLHGRFFAGEHIGEDKPKHERADHEDRDSFAESAEGEGHG